MRFFYIRGYPPSIRMYIEDYLMYIQVNDNIYEYGGSSFNMHLSEADTSMEELI